MREELGRSERRGVREELGRSERKGGVIGSREE